MGANIGTTITGQLIALDVGLVAPLIAFGGVVLVMFSKSKKLGHIGGIVAGLGILFIGMGIMSDAMLPLRDSEAFINTMTTFKNPLIGILAGALFTAVIQSSSASVGILQALAISGVIGLDSAVYVLFGQNIGTCITAVTASIGTNRNAKRTTIIHLLFNTIGTLIFVIICMTTPFINIIESFTPNNSAAQIANVHTVFNIATTLLLLPFGNYLARLAILILPDRKQETVSAEDKWLEEIMSNNYVLGTTYLAIHYIGTEVSKMYQLVMYNISTSFDLLSEFDQSKFNQIQNNENKIDELNYGIAKKISKVLSIGQSYEEVKILNDYFKALTNFERIGDHAMNFAEYAQTVSKNEWNFSLAAMEEVKEMKGNCLVGLDLFKEDLTKDELMSKAIRIEQQIDDNTSKFRTNQIERMNKHESHIESSILYSELLSDYERIGAIY